MKYVQPRKLSNFFDSRLPFYFVFGSILMSVIGNGVYALLTGVFGASIWDVGLITLGALLILVFVTISFGALLRAIARRPEVVKTIVPPEHIADPHVGLILAIGPNEDAADRNIISWHMRNGVLRHCWMIATPTIREGQKYRDIEHWLLENNVRPYLLSIDDLAHADQSYEAVERGLVQAQSILKDAALIVDVTGGNKLMTTGAVLACRDHSIAVQYWDTQRTPDGRPISGTGSPRKVSLKAAVIT